MTDNISKMFEKLGIEKGVYIGEVVDENSYGYPIFDNYRFFTSYEEYKNSTNYYDDNVQDKEDFEDWKEYPKFNSTKQMMLLKEISEQLNGIKICGDKYSVRVNGKTYKFTSDNLANALAQIVIEPNIFDFIDKDEIKYILKF